MKDWQQVVLIIVGIAFVAIVGTWSFATFPVISWILWGLALVVLSDLYAFNTGYTLRLINWVKSKF